MLRYSWTKKQAHAIERMDVRMAAAEAESLFGAAARKKYPLSKFPAPLIEIAASPEKTRAYLLATSMISSLKRAEELG